VQPTTKPDFSLLLKADAQPAVFGGSAPAARRWEAGSPLDWIDPKPGMLNVAGRARLKDGVLTPSPHTKRILSAADAADHDFLCLEDVFTAAECALLCDVFNRHKDLLYRGTTTDPYWNDRFLAIETILRVEPEAAQLMIAVCERTRARLAAFYKLTAPIYADILQLVQWPVGMSMPPHADNAHPDGSRHGMAYRDFGAITYLNDDYEGGELYLTALDIAIKPRRGMFLAFTAGFHHEHAVTKVTGGSTRMTMPSFFTFDRQRANPRLNPAAPAAARPA